MDKASGYIKILERYISSTPSTWRRDAEWRRNNRWWLKYSHSIANNILEHIDEVLNIDKSLLAQITRLPQDKINSILSGHECLDLKLISRLSYSLKYPLFADMKLAEYDDWKAYAKHIADRCGIIISQDKYENLSLQDIALIESRMGIKIFRDEIYEFMPF